MKEKFWELKDVNKFPNFVRSIFELDWKFWMTDWLGKIQVF